MSQEIELKPTLQARTVGKVFTGKRQNVLFKSLSQTPAQPAMVDVLRRVKKLHSAAISKVDVRPYRSEEE